MCSTKFVYQNLLYSIEYNKYNIWWINFRDILIRKYMQLFRVSGSKTFVKTSIFVFVQNPSFSPTSMVRLWYTSLRPLIYGTQSLTINCVKKDWHAMKLFFTFIFSNCNFQKKICCLTLCSNSFVPTQTQCFPRISEIVLSNH